MRIHFFIAAIAYLMLSGAQCASADMRRVWDEKPMTLILPVGQEVRVTFPTDVQVQVPLGISEKLTSLAPNPKMIYWTASEAFTNARIIATARDGGTVYVIDVAAEMSALREDIVIEDPARISLSDTGSLNAAQPKEKNDAEDEDALEDPAEIILTRFASQTLYAPSRLMPVDARISPVNYLGISKMFPLLQQ